MISIALLLAMFANAASYNVAERWAGADFL